jgi:hypothetical protein
MPNSRREERYSQSLLNGSLNGRTWKTYDRSYGITLVQLGNPMATWGMTDSKDSKSNLERLARVEARLGKGYSDPFRVVISKESLTKTLLKSDAIIQDILAECNKMAARRNALNQAIDQLLTLQVNDTAHQQQSIPENAVNDIEKARVDVLAEAMHVTRKIAKTVDTIQQSYLLGRSKVQFADGITSRFQTVEQAMAMGLEARVNENGKVMISEKDTEEEGMKMSDLFEID